MEVSVIKSLVEDFLEKLLINIDSLEVIEEWEKIYFVKIKTSESSLFIWYSGKNLEDIRNILKNIISKQSDCNVVLHLEVNDYISKKDDKLFNFISKKIDLLKRNWKEIILPYFNAYERKKIHSYVSELNDTSIFTKSVWEWEKRRLHLCKKSTNITIDIDWIDI